jgi:hypothetical protein
MHAKSCGIVKNSIRRIILCDILIFAKKKERKKQIILITDPLTETRVGFRETDIFLRMAL